MGRIVGGIMFLFLFAGEAYGVPDTAGVQVPITRQWIHDDIDHQQAIALEVFRNGLDSISKADPDSGILRSENALTRQVNRMQDEIERSAFVPRIKVIYLNDIYQILRIYSYYIQHGLIDPSLTPEIIRNFRDMMHTDMKGGSVADCVAGLPYRVTDLTLQPFQNNFGYRVGRSIVFREFARGRPLDVLSSLQGEFAEFLNEPFTDTIIASLARRYPQRVYDYATSLTAVGREIRKNPDSLVQTIVRIGNSPNAIKMMPFLDYLVDGTYRLAQLEKISRDRDAYYKLCVKTAIDMRRRKLKGQYVLNQKGMQQDVKLRALRYIRKVNDLHESPDPVRFACVNGLTAQQIYYLIINGEEEIYTSSYVGLFQRMMERMVPAKGDELLISVYFDHFKRFITMCAAYNTLDEFLKSMVEANSTALMQEFVRGLQNTGTLEDAVDVADAFGSIQDSSLLLFLRREVDKNYLEMRRQHNERGEVIYSLLASLFTGRESSKKDSVWTRDIATSLNLPPIDKVPFRNLLNDSGRVYEEVFFYGDKDGFESLNSFMGNFPSSIWRLSRAQYWEVLRSLKGKPITIYVKLPFLDPDEDEKAMTELDNYLNSRDIHPTVYIHRGHSYHVEATLTALQNSAKVVMLGSCGGYNSLASVLDIAPQAQIISSKQTGTMFVNEPVIRAIEETIRAGRDLDWISLWDKLDLEFRNTPHYQEFLDYIPPHKNMGAIFIKAYRQLMKEKGTVQPSGMNEPPLRGEEEVP